MSPTAGGPAYMSVFPFAEGVAKLYHSFNLVIACLCTESGVWLSGSTFFGVVIIGNGGRALVVGQVTLFDVPEEVLEEVSSELMGMHDVVTEHQDALLEADGLESHVTSVPEPLSTHQGALRLPLVLELLRPRLVVLVRVEDDRAG